MTEPGKIRLVVLFGGQSAEHDVSCTTATHVITAAAASGHYEIEPVGITRDGTWVRAEAAAELLAAKEALPAALSPDGPTVEPGALLAPVDEAQTVALPLLHGPLGEDGTVQGLLELAGVPYVGSGVLGSALAMDKVKAKEAIAHAGIAQTRWRPLFEPTWDGDLDAIVDDLGLPAFVKPANMGSSVGVSKCRTLEELAAGIEAAFRYDEWVVVEEAVTAREIELAVLGNIELKVSVAGEILPAADFYDYDDKYLAGNSSEVIPAALPDGAEAELQQLAAEAFRVLRCEGLARADFLYEEGGRGPLLNELNTMPGFTPISMYPKLWAASGLDYPDLIDELVRLALERHGRRSAKRVTTR